MVKSFLAAYWAPLVFILFGWFIYVHMSSNERILRAVIVGPPVYSENVKILYVTTLRGNSFGLNADRFCCSYVYEGDTLTFDGDDLPGRIPQMLKGYVLQHLPGPTNSDARSYCSRVPK